MNIHNNKSGIFESSLKAQSEMQSCKLNESESKPNVTLKKMGQELDKAETKCFTLKSELNYVMGVCQKVKSEMKSNKEKSDISLKSIRSSFENPKLKFSIERNDYNNEIMIANKIPNYNLQRFYNIERKAEDFDTLHLNSKSTQLSSREIVDNDDVIEESESFQQQKQNELLNVKIVPKIQLDKKFPIAMPLQNEILKASREYENPQPYFSEYMQEHLQSMLNERDSVEELISKMNEENHFRVIPPISAKKDIKNTELNSNIPDTAKVRRTERNKRASKNQSNSIYNKASDTLFKMRKRKCGRLRCSVSKSTVTIKDTSLIGRKETKNRKHKDRGVTHRQSNLSKNSKKSNDVIEIFHNTIMKDSNSGISSKHSKFDKQAKFVKKHPTETANQKIQETLYPKHANHEHQFDNENKEIKQHNECPQSLNYQCDSGTIPEKIQKYDEPEKCSNNLYPSAQCKTDQCKYNVLNKCNDDPMFIPSYEMPTLSSRLKRSNKSYFNRFNFRNIPFVVGTSVTPSHNLGLNIQQVLSVMKTRQPIANNIIDPLLFRKVGKGMKPMSILLEQINGYSEKSSLNINSHPIAIFNNDENSNINRDKKLSVFDLQHVKNARTSNISDNAKIIPEKNNNIIKQFNKEKIDSYDHKIKQQFSNVINKSNKLVNVRNQQGILKTNIGDYKMRTFTGVHNSKEMRNILINLHDHFEDMNTKYKKLHPEMEKSNDKSLAKELSAMEKELNIKKEEINAGLYKEVMMLKQEMKTLNEKNSLACIKTESAKGSYKNHFPLSILPDKSHSINPTQIFGRRKFNPTREPPISMQLTALLRQIQTFHKQMQLVL